jgi:hypothetical protein
LNWRTIHANPWASGQIHANFSDDDRFRPTNHTTSTSIRATFLN